jgi:hypothetical protein
MEFFSISIHWIKPDGTDGDVRFVCQKSQIPAQINNSIVNEVAPAFQKSCVISIDSIGAVRGPVT